MSRTEILHTVNEVNERGKFKPTWESLAQFSVPAWYLDAKFGIFIHWGVYCVPVKRMVPAQHVPARLARI
jgi:alpha-L-fucosidase